MCASIIKDKREGIERSKDTGTIYHKRIYIKRKTEHKSSITTNRDIILELFHSQAILFNSRRKWGMLFAMATLSGIFCVPTATDQVVNDIFKSKDAILVLAMGLLPISTLLIITGMYVLNDILDVDLDRMNGKTNRPIPSGRVSKRQALLFVIGMNLLGLSIAMCISNMMGLLATTIIVLIGILYSIPKISLKDRFIIKTFAISVVMMCSLLVGASVYSSNGYLKIGIDSPVDESTYSVIVPFLIFPMFSGIMLFLMVFVTSPLNDLADIKGDKDVGRKTIPLVIGKEKTVKLSILISLSIAISTWLLYVFLTSFSGNNVPYTLALVLPSAVSATIFIAVLHLVSVLKHLEDRDFIRRSITKRSMPLHLLLQASLAIGCSMFY